MSFVERERPPADADLRRALYAGRVFLLPPTSESRALVRLARERLHVEVGDEPRGAHERFDDAEIFERIGRVRRAIYTEPGAHTLLQAMAASVGFDARETAFDPARLRAILHGAAGNPRAAPVYFPHRDTWYGHPTVGRHDLDGARRLSEEETFIFYPRRFDAPVSNDSECFDYDAWVAQGWSLKVGWQDREASLRAHYPGVSGAEDYGPPQGFACKAGAVLLFSGAHFHRTLPQNRGRSRFSLDARLVHLGDHARWSRRTQRRRSLARLGSAGLRPPRRSA